MNVGMQLREAREARGLSLDALASATRIKVHVLEGLERNDLTAAPPRPYARGFVAAYAREVGLDADQTARSYFAQFATPVEPPPLVIEPVLPIEESPWRRLVVPMVAVVLVALVAAAAGLVAINRRAAVLERESGAIGTAGTIPASAAAAQPGATVGTAAQTPQAAAAVRAAGGTAVTLVAERPVWVSATADGKRVVYRIMQGGDTETVRASRDLVLRVGDAGAVRWSVNGAAPAVMGERGEVRTARLPADAPR